MIDNFLPYQQALDLKELGFDEECFDYYDQVPAPLYQQAFKFFRDKYNFLYSIGKTNISVYHIPVSNYHTTFLIQDNASYEVAELETIKAFIDHAKQQ